METIMSYTIKLICSEHGNPKKIIQADEALLKNNKEPVDEMNKAFLTPFSPFQSPKVSLNPKKTQMNNAWTRTIDFQL